MAGFPYGAARGLGGLQIFMGLAAMGLGSGDMFIGAAQAMSLLNAVVFAPGLVAVTLMSAIQVYARVDLMFVLEITLVVVGVLESIVSIATASVCCCWDPYDQPAVNQVGPMTAYPTTMQPPDVTAPMQSNGFAESPGLGEPSTSLTPGGATGGDGQMVTLPAAELGVLYAEAKNSRKVVKIEKKNPLVF
ncbi:Hypp4863 [Branchiostoma lanceolatum]|uniref:Hypp4863 protein n=1 Tax=Branchiostoma lanceolatum TaxID=7740 RepID=A0A8K0AD29_BRALA|nr:Hypp4863 [Branchiostoma lanceolatum]